jgi:predicted MPP superfamily phosphohydrolase
MYKILTVLILAALAAWAFYFEPSSQLINNEKIVVPAWPDACNGKRIAILADLHVGSPYKGLDSLKILVNDVNNEAPDLILLPGDFVIHGVVGGSFVTPEKAAKILTDLHAPMGVYAVLGNHDWWLDPDRVQKALENNNIIVLEDKSRYITSGKCQLRLVGISDFWEGPHDIEPAMSKVKPGEHVLAFTHNPDVFPELPAKIALTIAGHTHGGQVYLPGIGRPIVPSQYG